MSYEPSNTYKRSPADTLKQALEVLSAWRQMPDLVLAGITLEEFEREIGLLEYYVREYEEQAAIATTKRHRSNDQRYKVWDIIMRSRKNVNALFGNDSNEYDLFGGTRWSNRRSHADQKKEKAAAKPAATQSSDKTASAAAPPAADKQS